MRISLEYLEVAINGGTIIQGMLGWADNDDKRKPYRWRIKDPPPQISKKLPKSFCNAGMELQGITHTDS